MNDEEIWELAKKPVTEFVESIKEMKLNVDRLVQFYLKYSKGQESETPMLVDGISKETNVLDEQRVLSPLACAKLELAIVFSINVCYRLYLVTHGNQPNTSDVTRDSERIRLFMDRAREVEESLSDTCSSAKRPRIDVL